MMRRTITALTILGVLFVSIQAALGGFWMDEFEVDCTNGLDDDLDGKIDCEDNDCNAALTGVVEDDSGQPVQDATVRFFDGLTVLNQTQTNSTGGYGFDLKCGTFDGVASHPDYIETTQEDITIPHQTPHEVDFVDENALTPFGQCLASCRRAGSDHFYKECHGINNCNYYDNRAAEACHLAKAGWVRDYNETHYLVCAKGVPIEKVNIETDVSCPTETLVKTTSITRYNGQPVKMVVVVCG